MGPQVILDKSALQSLSKDEAFQLGTYLMIVIPPVLLAEIQANLTKASHAKKSQRAALRNEAAEQAEKLHSMISRGFNIPRRLLILQDLVGQPVGMDGRPVVGGTHVVTEEGKRGFWVADQQERILFAWRGGDFSAMRVTIPSPGPAGMPRPGTVLLRAVTVCVGRCEGREQAESLRIDPQRHIGQAAVD